MEPSIIVALIGVAGAAVVAILNHFLAQRLREQENRIDRLYALSMSDDLFRHLKKLNTDSFGPYWIDPEMKFGLGPELNYLKMLGYIKFDKDPDVPDIREMPKGDNPELSRYINVTQQGRDFISLREQSMKNA
jgi:hypothetical protein